MVLCEWRGAEVAWKNREDSADGVLEESKGEDLRKGDETVAIVDVNFNL